jgi:hypothetical protein
MKKYIQKFIELFKSNNNKELETKQEEKVKVKAKVKAVGKKVKGLKAKKKIKK